MIRLHRLPPPPKKKKGGGPQVFCDMIRDAEPQETSIGKQLGISHPQQESDKTTMIILDDQSISLKKN